MSWVGKIKRWIYNLPDEDGRKRCCHSFWNKQWSGHGWGITCSDEEQDEALKRGDIVPSGSWNWYKCAKCGNNWKVPLTGIAAAVVNIHYMQDPNHPNNVFRRMGEE